jgi:putative tricarboxylic transport membrane protein
MMTRLSGRASAVLFLVVSAALIIWIIPQNTETGFVGSLQPSTMPTVAAALMGLGAAIAIFERSAADAVDTGLLRRALAVIALLLVAALMTHFIGFRWVAPLLCLVTMLLSGERRPAWLFVGAGVVPGLIWAIFEVGLGRPLP